MRKQIKRKQVRVTPVFTKTVEVLVEKKPKILIHRGGTRSSKTYSLSQLMVNWLITGRIKDQYRPDGVWSTVREHSTTLKATVMRDFEEIIDEWGMWYLIKRYKQDRTYQCGKRMVEFFGADNGLKVRGGKRNILYCNEGNELKYDIFKQLLLRTSNFAIIDFNPDDDEVWINTKIEMERKEKKSDVEVIVSTYKDNPFLPKEMVQEIEYLKETDEVMRQVFGLGMYGVVEGLIFKHIEIIDAVPENAKYISHGLDFGYTNDPSALIAVYMMDNEIILDEILYARGLTNDDIHDEMTELGLEQHSLKMRADSSEPKSIEELYRKGRDIEGTLKGPDSVIHGLNFMKKYKISVTSRSINLRKEFRKYIWRKDKEGKYLNKPIDKFNHGIDAARYALWMGLYGGESPEMFFDDSYNPLMIS